MGKKERQDCPPRFPIEHRGVKFVLTAPPEASGVHHCLTHEDPAYTGLEQHQALPSGLE